MMNVRSFWIIALSALFAAGLGCSDAVTSGDDCPEGQEIDPISGECADACPVGEELNPMTKECEPASDANDNDPNNGQPDNDDPNQTDPNDDPNQTDPNDDPNQTDPNDDPNQTDPNDDPNQTDPDPVDPTEDDGIPPYDPYEEGDTGDDPYHSCDSEEFEGVEPPRFIHHGAANYLLAAEQGVEASGVALPSGGAMEGHFFEHADDGYAGFVMSFAPPSGEDTDEWVHDRIDQISGYDATLLEEGRSYLTHDNLSASILNHVEIDTQDAPPQIRNEIVARITGLDADDFDYSLDDAADADGSPARVLFKTVTRSDVQTIVVGAITTADRYEQPEGAARFAAEDLAGGTSLAAAGETMSEECVSLEIKDTDEVDIIVSMDASGSMEDVQANIADFSEELTQVLDNAGVDWRVGVTGVDCDEIRDDEALSQEFRAMWPDPDEWESDNPFPFPGDFDDFDTPCKDPDIMMGDFGNNGRLMEGTFTTDPDEIEERIGMVSTTGLEYTLTMGIAALDHTLPRADDDPEKLRTHAAPVVIAVTDENEQLFKDAFQSWISGGNDPLSSDEESELEEFIQPWLDFVHRPDLNATISGLYWVPGTDCDGGIDVGHGIHKFVESTGGVYDSICSPDIADAFGDIADATQELETGLHLVGNPHSASVRVDLEDLGGGSPQPIDRSTVDGFDIDTTNNSLFFEGPSTPEDGERVIVPYLQWDGGAMPCSNRNPCPDDLECVKGVCQ